MPINLFRWLKKTNSQFQTVVLLSLKNTVQLGPVGMTLTPKVYLYGTDQTRPLASPTGPQITPALWVPLMLLPVTVSTYFGMGNGMTDNVRI